MILPVIHRLEIVVGPTAGTLLGIPRLITEDGKILDSGESVPLAAGQSILFGPFDLVVSHEATFHNGATPDQVKTPSTPAPAAKVPASPAPGAKR